MDTQRIALISTGLAALCLGSTHAGPLTIPNEFTSGTPAVAAEVNANFSATKAAVDDNNSRIGALEDPSSLPRFVDNGDGTITDNLTGLMWEKKDSADSSPDFSNPSDVDNTYTWSASSSLTPDGTISTDFLDRLNNHVNLTPEPPLAGFTDWRIPTLFELRSITEAGCAVAPCIIDPVFEPTISNFYWTRTRTFDPDFAMTVQFSDGTEPSFFKPAAHHVRAVRRHRN